MATYETEHCNWCGGTGKVVCDRCHGNGKILGNVNFNKYYTCSKCGGTGEVECGNCSNGYVYKLK